MLHGKGMAIVVAYDIYKEACKGNLNVEWKVDKPCSFYEFQEKLARQMLQYHPKQQKYPGDDSFRVCTQQAKSKRALPQCNQNHVIRPLLPHQEVLLLLPQAILGSRTRMSKRLVKDLLVIHLVLFITWTLWKEILCKVWRVLSPRFLVL